MNAYIYTTGTTIYPFGDSICDLQIFCRSFDELQKQELRKAGLEPISVVGKDNLNEEPPYILIPDNLCLSAQAVKLVLRNVAKRGESFKLHLRNGYYSDVYLWGENSRNDTIPIDFFYVHDKKQTVGRKIIDIDCRKFSREKLPPTMEKNARGFDYPQTDFIMIPIMNWVNLWQANIAFLMKHAFEWEYTRRYRQIIPIVRALGSIERAPLYINKIGRNCSIHPSAVVEASIIGDNVHIGANAVVRLCNVADHAYISDQALLRVSNIGKNAYIANNNNVAFCTVYSGAFLISGPYQFSIFGKECAVLHCIDCDCRLDRKTIKASIAEFTRIDTNQLYVGSCFGHRVRIGAGTIISPGSAVPNNLWINPNPSLVIKGLTGLPEEQNLFLSEDGVITNDQQREKQILTSPHIE